ncbi:MAG TPA: SH3 domain-containing protein [Accumulibacter sp.]|uniref:SH3 domain protein n=2 Tax=Candidatus Accumulibacter TaxID=327159 RepID=A0A080M8P5_9PROT|nr:MULTISPECIES: SH3 domain-containing protein [Candidatus Accumulibacter]KFB77588.1 MAG: SH3 domain protein [Candidatus Accumulibacter cognatus]MBL8399629.1 SH3 domain-containing protein [Accumulibacter sp.]MBN8519051.1 SH3 domain-containing protein [Accumulibacter sp.]MBO3711581.1 SH3 domain-containing protein [Accumulibacter sp.]MCC2868998.1 SH3 domain-containing protein [Candidatus Accumulibacter phosphatis]
MKRLLGLLLGAGLAVPALAIEYRTVNIATVLYDAPSLRGSKLFVIRRGTPVELVVNLEGWSKVRDADGGLAWIEAAALVKRRSVIVTVARAQVRQNADEAAALVFEAEKNVSLEYLETSPGGWVKVRHREGQTGFVRVNQIWGF